MVKIKMKTFQSKVIWGRLFFPEYFTNEIQQMII